MPPHSLRASSQRAYELLVLNTNNSDNAKLAELIGAVRLKLIVGNAAGSTCVCNQTPEGYPLSKPSIHS